MSQKKDPMQITPARLDAIKKARVLTVGDVMLDRYWFGEVDRISPEAPVPVVRVNRWEERLGGAANVARNVVALGAEGALLGVVGKDESGDRIEVLLRQDGIASHLMRDSAAPTIVKLRVIGKQQQLLRVDFEDPPSETALNDKLVQFNTLLHQYDVMVLSDYAKGSLINISAMIAAAKRVNKPVLIDPKGDDFARYAGATLLTPNKSELRRIVGSWTSEEQLTERAQRLRRSLDCEALLLTRSEEGMTLYTEEGKVHVPAVAREVYDVSGAGDTVIATLGVMLAVGVPISEAVTIANKAGGIVVGKFGTATVTREELFE